MNQFFSQLGYICNQLLMVVGVVFPLTTAYMYWVVRSNGDNPSLMFAKSKLSIDFDLKMFSYLRQQYSEIKGSALLPVLNKVSFYIAIFAVIGSILCAVLEAGFINK